MLTQAIAFVRDEARQFRARDPRGLATHVFASVEHDDGSWESVCCPDATAIRQFASRGVPAERLRELRLSVLDGRSPDAVVWVVLSNRGELGARTFTLDALN
jgi:hypothetical protein